MGREARVWMKNLAMEMLLDAAIGPTNWQADAHPPALRRKIAVIHDGTDTNTTAPDPAAGLEIAGHGSWTASMR